MAEKKPRARWTRWLACEPGDLSTARLLGYMLREIRRAERWVEELQEKEIPQGSIAYQARQLRRKYLQGRVELHSIPGSVFEEGMAEALHKRAAGERIGEAWTLVMPLREGWTGERTPDSPGTGFRFDSLERDAAARWGRFITPERAEYELFVEGVMHWQWGSLRLTSKGLAKEREIERVGFFGRVERIELHKSPKSVGSFAGWKIRFRLR